MAIEDKGLSAARSPLESFQVIHAKTKGRARALCSCQTGCQERRAPDLRDYTRNVTSLESSPHANSRYCHLLYSSDVVIDSGLQVSVYPNPYKLRFKDAYGNWTSYEAQGYERTGKGEEEERNRRIWFINLPDTAEINIYTLDGDLVRKILHPDPHLTTYPSIVGWDLISRNQQAVVSGIYIWRVDSRLGRQIGKLVIIK